MHKFRSKFGAIKTGGHASKKEHKRALELRLMQSAGQIRNLELHRKWLLIPSQKRHDGSVAERPCTYISDFSYEVWPDWHLIVEDSKGFRTEVFKIKKKLMRFIHGIEVIET